MEILVDRCALVRSRQARSLTQERVAAAVGLTSSTVSHAESGYYAPQLDTLARLARFYGEPIEQFLIYRDEAVA